jgi:hypothetical protein
MFAMESRGASAREEATDATDAAATELVFVVVAGFFKAIAPAKNFKS